MDVETIATALRGTRSGDGWMCPCPCPGHDDKHPSLSISEGSDGRPLVYCHAGCEQDAVISALKALGLWPEYKRTENHERAKDTAKLVSPIPAGTGLQLPLHPKHGKHSALYRYRDAGLHVLLDILRDNFRTPFLVTVCRPTLYRHADSVWPEPVDDYYRKTIDRSHYPRESFWFDRGAR